jgi:hypothetical protein
LGGGCCETVSVIYVIRTGGVEGRACFNPLDSENSRSGCIISRVRLSPLLQRDGNRRALRMGKTLCSDQNLIKRRVGET